MPVQPIPSDYPRANPFLIVSDINAEVKFLSAAFGARESERIQLPDGTVMHVEMRIGESVIMLGRASPGMYNMHSMTYLYMEDTAEAYRKALEAGAESVMPPGEQFYGDINAGIKDPQGHYWWIASRFEEVTEEEMNRRAAAMNEK